jgi:hypothetical protein
VLARLFNEASGQKAPSKKHGLLHVPKAREINKPDFADPFVSC